MASPNMSGASRIHGELLKLGIEISEAAVSKYLPAVGSHRRRLGVRSSRITWTHLCPWIFFTVLTVFFHVMFVFVVLAHDRRRILSINVTSNPSAARTANQIVQTFPWESARRYLLRDRDGICGSSFRRRVHHLGIEEVVIARRSPWQSPYVERVIGALRRELLDHAIVLNERHLRLLLRRFVAEYYHPCRTHLSLGEDTPESRAVETPEMGEVVELPLVGGLHHRDVRRAA
jgi:putative transposase